MFVSTGTRQERACDSYNCRICKSTHKYEWKHHEKKTNMKIEASYEALHSLDISLYDTIWNEMNIILIRFLIFI